MKASPEKLKVVIADDSRIYRMLVQRALGLDEYEVLTAENGREATALVLSHQPAVVVTDWEMPDVTGLELCRQVRQESGPYTYIILLTANGAKEQIIQGLRAGADDYLTKPFDGGELRARVGVGRRMAELHRQIQAKNRLLEELALTDALTGLPNRRAVEQWTLRELSGAARHGFSVWVVIADLDHFKSINDSYGHAAGDLVLKQFAVALKANTRASNICGRIGGEEFVVVLSHVDKEGVRIAVDRLRQQFEKEAFKFGAQTVHVTASFGVSGFCGKNAPEFAHLLREADNALYLAKHRGRNRIEFAETGPAMQMAANIQIR